MNHSPLDNPLEPRRWLGFLRRLADEIGQLIVNIISQIIAQFLEINTTGAQHGNGVLVFGQRQQQMLQRGIFLAPFSGEGEGAVEGFFKTAGKRGQGSAP